MTTEGDERLFDESQNSRFLQLDSDDESIQNEVVPENGRNKFVNKRVVSLGQRPPKYSPSTEDSSEAHVEKKGEMMCEDDEQIQGFDKYFKQQRQPRDFKSEPSEENDSDEETTE